MRIAFKNGTIHECTGVTLVSITYDIFLRSFVRCAESPLASCGESAAASSAESGIGHAFDNVLGSHLCEGFTECCITVHSDILFDVLGIDNTAVSQSDTLLSFVETSLGQSCLHILFCALVGVIVYKTLDGTALKQMLLNDLGNIRYFYTAVESSVGINDDDRTERTKSEASCLNKLDLIFQVVVLELCCKFIADLGAAG